MEDFTKTLNNLGQDALKGAKKLKEIASTNIEILSEEDKRKNQYIALGKLYYAAHGQDTDGEFAEACALIKASEDKLSELNDKLARLKGMKKCTACGADMKADSLFCPKCGKETVEKEQTAENESAE